MSTILDIPPGWEQFRQTRDFDAALAASFGARFVGPVEDRWVLMRPEDYARCKPWPFWAVAVRKLASEDDKGVGDTIRRLTGLPGVAFKATMKALGVPCGCDSRRDDWNTQYRYD